MLSSMVTGGKIICRDVHGGRHEVAVADLSFRPSVYGVAIRDEKVLLVPQWDGYDFPGGGIDLGETLDEAFRREVFEETGLAVERGAALASESDFFIYPYTGKPYHTVLMYFLCENVSGGISDQNFDEHEKKYAKKAEWIDIRKVRGLKFYNPVDSSAIISKAAGLLR